jgi:hypothetical protein
MSDEMPARGEDKPWKRRGLFAAAAALVAAVVGRVTEQPVSAGVDGDVVLGASNVSTSSTNISNPAPRRPAVAVTLDCPIGDGLYARGGDYGVIGDGGGSGFAGVGVLGTASLPGSCGVLGSNAQGVAVRGFCSNGTGGRGTNIAIYGEVAPPTFGNAVAVFGRNSSSAIGGFGVYGVSDFGNGLGGVAGTAGSAGVVGATNGVGAFAGIFYGPVVVDGAFTVVGGPKSAAVPHPDGSHHRLYCVESPESWFEDFGKGQLEGGCATVAIDPDFAAVVDLTDYHVFLTGYDDFDLRVSEQSLIGFRVVAKDALSLRRFSWRVVAKRKDIAAPRFQAVTIPPAPTLPSIPDVPAAPPRPVMATR